MHPLLLILALWVAVGVVSLLAAVLLHTLLPVGPFLAAVLALIVGLAVVFVGFLTGWERTIRRRGE